MMMYFVFVQIQLSSGKWPILWTKRPWRARKNCPVRNRSFPFLLVQSSIFIMCAFVLGDEDAIQARKNKKRALDDSSGE